MYGTIARLKLKPGKEADMIRMTRETAVDIPGFVFQHIYKMDSGSNEFFLVVGFTNKAAYVANANSPEQAARYAEYLTFLDGAPEWHDGEVVSSFPA